MDNIFSGFILSSLSTAAVVDALGHAKAESARVKLNEDDLAAELKRRFQDGGKPEGVQFDASVATCPGRESWDSDWLREHLHANQLRHALKAGQPFQVVKVVAKRKEAA
jgi:hypothetical protein